MSCNETEKIDRLLGRSLSPEETAALELHLADCAECREEKERCERENKEFAGLLAGRRLQKDLVSDVMAATAKARKDSRRSNMRTWMIVISAAAVLIAITIPALTGSLMQSQRASSGRMTIAPAPLSMPHSGVPEPRGREEGRYGKGGAPVNDLARTNRLPVDLDGQGTVASAQELEEAPLPTVQVPADRKIIRTATMSLEVEAYDTAYAKVQEIAGAANGFVAGADIKRQADNKVSATITLRLPPEAFETALAALSKLGTVRNQSVNSQDVTKQYTDLQARLGAKQVLEERLKKIIATGSGEVKDLLAAEAQLGNVIEQIESIKGEIKYYDNLAGLATITLTIVEKAREQTLAYVETLNARIAVAALAPEGAFAKAQGAIAEAGGRILSSNLARTGEDEATGTIRAQVDIAKFEEVRKKLTALGDVLADTAENVRTSHGSAAGDTSVKREQAALEFTVSTPPIVVTRSTSLTVEVADVEKAYEEARRAALGAGGRILDGRLTGDTKSASASVTIQVSAKKYGDLMSALKTLGGVKNESTAHTLPYQASAVREHAQIALSLRPPGTPAEGPGFIRELRDSFTGSLGALARGFRRIAVAAALAAPWLAVLAAALLVWRLLRRRRKAA